jgi:hypothetical protein
MFCEGTVSHKGFWDVMPYTLLDSASIVKLYLHVSYAVRCVRKFTFISIQFSDLTSILLKKEIMLSCYLTVSHH